MNAVIDLLINLLSFLWNIAKLLIPIMVIIEIFKDTKLIDKITSIFRPVTNFFTLSEKAGVALLFGMFFGLTIGAGAILQSVKDYDVDKRSVFLVIMFVSLCHAVFEDSFIMAAVGANIAQLLLARFGAAILLTFLLSRFIKKTDDSLKINE